MLAGRIRWWGIALPLLLILMVESLHYGVLEDRPEAVWEHIATTVALSVGVLAYGTLMVLILERMHRKGEQLYRQVAAHRDQLAALHEAGLAVTSDLDTAAVLGRVTELGRAVVGAQQVALTLTPFTDPSGPVSGANSPAPTAGEFEGAWTGNTLGVPVLFRGKMLGHLEVSGKSQGAFQPSDAEALQRFAAHAAVALANARLYEKAERVAALEERDRIAMELHDGTIQSLYAISLSLQDAKRRLLRACPSTCRSQMSVRLEAAVDGIGHVLDDIRCYVLNLRSSMGPTTPLGAEMARLVAAVGLSSQVQVSLDVSEEAEGLTHPEVAPVILRVAREALSNVLKHAAATRVDVAVTATPRAVQMRIFDDGVGFDPNRSPGTGHYGLRNMQERALAAGGCLRIGSEPGAGCAVELTCPLDWTAEEEVGAHGAATGGG